MAIRGPRGPRKRSAAEPSSSSRKQERRKNSRRQQPQRSDDYKLHDPETFMAQVKAQAESIQVPKKADFSVVKAKSRAEMMSADVAERIDVLSDAETLTPEATSRLRTQGRHLQGRAALGTPEAEISGMASASRITQDSAETSPANRATEIAEAHSTPEALLDAAETFGFDWRRAKQEHGDDAERMWQYNALRQKFYFEPVKARAVEKYAQALRDRWGAERIENVHVVEHPNGRDFSVRFQHRESGQDYEVRIAFSASGSTDKASDIDCAIDINDRTQFTLFYACLMEASHEVLDELAQYNPNLISRSANHVFDVNFYDPSFGRADGVDDMSLPFMVFSEEALSARLMMDIGAGLKRLYYTEGKVDALANLASELRGPGAGRPAHQQAFQRIQRQMCLADDYGLLRESDNLRRRALAVLEQFVPVQSASDSEQRAAIGGLADALDATPQKLALEHLQSGEPMTGDERQIHIRALQQLEQALDAVAATDIQVDGRNLVEEARASTFLAHQNAVESDVLERLGLLKAMGTSMGKIDPAIYRTEAARGQRQARRFSDRADALALRIHDSQVASDTDADERYGSSASLQRIVAGQQRRIGQIETADVQAPICLASVQSDIGFAAIHNCAEFADTPDPFGAYLVAISKYLDRAVTESMSLDKTAWDRFRFQTQEGHELTGADVAALGKALVRAKKAETGNAAAARDAAEEAGLVGETEVVDLMWSILRHSRQAYVNGEVQRQVEAETRRRLNQEL